MEINSTLKAAILFALILLTGQFAHATVYTWNWTNGISPDFLWSDGNNWSPVGVPGAADSLIYNSVNSGGLCIAPGPGLNIAGGGQTQIISGNFNGIVDSKFGGTIGTVIFSNLQSSYQNILITNNSTLTITNGFTLGNGVAAATGGITPGSGGIDYGATGGFVTIAGTNATLLMNNTNENLWVTEGSATSSSAISMSLDMSALDNFNATINRILVGVPAVNRPGGIIYLAATNNITAEFQTTGVLTSDTVGTGAIVVADSTSNGGSAADDLYLGLVNTISADTIAVGRQKQQHGLIAFNPNLLGPQIPTVTLQGFSAPQAQIWDIGDGVANSGTDTTIGAMDFTLGIVNASVSNIYVGKGPTAGTGNNASTGTLTFGAGKINASSLYIGYHNNTSLPHGNGTVTVNTNSTITNYATLVVSNNLYLTYAIPTAPAATGSSGTLNIAGGAVWANNITSATNGLSMINMTAGTLVISNYAGTLSAPISNLFLAGTVQLSIAGSVPEMVTSNLSINGPVTVNIAALPPILQYPAQFPLMKYLSTFAGDPTQVTVGGLPGGSPAYQGTISNNVANSSIDLVLTTGPVISGVDTWVGAVNSNWDTITLNWLNGSSPIAFATGTPVLFNDSAEDANVNITVNVSPAQVAVSNSLMAYTFSGPGGIGGPGALIKAGTNTLLITNTGNNTFSGGVIISNGTVQFGNGGANGNLPGNGAPIMDNGTLILAQSPNVNLSSPITGSGSVVQNGSNALDLTGSNSYAGITLVDSGTLLLDGWLDGGLLTNAPGTTIGGNGTNLGPFTVAGIVNPGDVNAIGTLTAGNGLTLAPSAVGYFDLNPNNPTTGSGVNDLLQVTGNLNVNNNTIWANIQGVPFPGSSWQVISYTGNLNGTLNPVLAGTHFTGTVSTSQAGTVYASITGGSGANLKWASTNSGVWDNSTSNWFNFSTSGRDFFASGDNVQFDDSVANAMTNITLATGVAVYPNAVTNISSVNNYTISGPGTIAGTATLVKAGGSILTINTTNSFSGGASILSGTLRSGSATALGTGTTTVSGGATLDVDGSDLGNLQVQASGAGVNGQGAIVNSGAQQINALKFLTLLGDTTFGGPIRWDVRGSGAILQANGSPVTITKIGTNQNAVVACTASDVNLENLVIQQGSFAIQTTTTQFGDPNGLITVYSNANLEVWGLTAGLNKNILLQDGGQIWSENNQTTISGTIFLTNNLLAQNVPGTGIITNDANGTGYSLVIASTITGPGNLLKTGTGTTELTGANTYTGGTTVAQGILLLAGSIPTTTNINVVAGAVLDASLVSPWSLAPGQTLLGGGTINGSVTVPSGATLAPGTPGGTGTLTISNGVTLAGTTIIKIAAGSNDMVSSPVSGVGSIALGGTLIISNIGNVAPTNGQTFTLFSTPTLSGSFASVQAPPPGAGLAWNTANLSVNGTITVIPGALPLAFNAPSFASNAITISGKGGTANDLYYVLTSTNLALPISKWTPIITNNFDSGGNFSYTATNVSSGTQRFYIIEQP